MIFIRAKPKKRDECDSHCVSESVMFLYFPCKQQDLRKFLISLILISHTRQSRRRRFFIPACLPPKWTLQRVNDFHFLQLTRINKFRIVRQANRNPATRRHISSRFNQSVDTIKFWRSERVRGQQECEPFSQFPENKKLHVISSKAVSSQPEL